MFTASATCLMIAFQVMSFPQMLVLCVFYIFIDTYKFLLNFHV
ncbi:hypothetical protein BVRB_9g224170 [Beta vulgaris subsp. vulgaris]|nr:hypothetical protein BVRB_9g224170 [Beta vulgaris subsp. vulgaris]